MEGNKKASLCHFVLSKCNVETVAAWGWHAAGFFLDVKLPFDPLSYLSTSLSVQSFSSVAWVAFFCNVIKVVHSVHMEIVQPTGFQVPMLRLV
jgi:hypothetical protein